MSLKTVGHGVAGVQGVGDVRIVITSERSVPPISPGCAPEAASSGSRTNCTRPPSCFAHASSRGSGAISGGQATRNSKLKRTAA